MMKDDAMKAIRILSASTVLALAMGCGSAYAADTDTASASAKADIIQAITISKTSDLAFGRAAIPTSAGTTTVVLSTANVQSGTADFVSTQTTSNAVFAVAGEGTYAYTPLITVTDAGLTGLTLSGMKAKCGAGADQNLTLGSATGLTGCALTAGADTVRVGGTLSISTTATAGSAKTVGTIQVVVSYN